MTTFIFNIYFGQIASKAAHILREKKQISKGQQRVKTERQISKLSFEFYS